MNQEQPPRFYFALPRLLAKMRGADASRAEQNNFEAWAANLAIYLISYFYFLGLIPAPAGGLLRLAAFVALAFVVWIFWLLVLYLNSLILKLARILGGFHATPTRRGQSVLIVIVTTAMATGLLQYGSWLGELGAIWLVATAMNLTAAVILALTNGEPTRP